jgi:hypothetical protein
MSTVYVSTQEIANRARICKRLRSPGIDSKESIPPVFVAWRAGTTTLFAVPSLESIPVLLKRLQIRPLNHLMRKQRRNII